MDTHIKNLQNRDTVVPNARTQPSSTRANNRHGFGWQVLCTALPILALLFAAPITLAETGLVLPPGLEISGFGTLGAMQTDTDQVEVTRDQSQQHGATDSISLKQDSLIGLQAYYKANESLDFVVQGVSRYGPHANYRPELMAAFGRYAITPNFGIRAGRIGTEFYMLADSRLVGYSYLTVRPPREVFATLPFQYLDGADFTASAPIADGILKGRVFLGQSGEEAPAAGDFLDLSGSPLTGAYLDYQTGHWQWRLTYAQIKFKDDIPGFIETLRTTLSQVGQMGIPKAAAAGEAISLKDTVSRFYSLGAVYDQGPLQVQGMVVEMQHDSAIYQNSLGAYVVAGYRIGQLTPYAGVSWIRSQAKHVDSGLPDAAPLSQALQRAIARTHMDQTTFTLGTRWDFRRNMALKAQVDFVRGASDSLFLYPISDEAFDGKLNVYSVSLDFVF